MSRLPLGWADSKIGDICAYVSRGKSPKYTERSELPVVNQKAIRWFGIQDEHLKYIHPDQFDQWAEERFIRKGDILWNSTGTGTIGRACLVSQNHLSPPKVVDSHVTIVRPHKNAVDPRYLFGWIRGPQIQHKIEDLATGTTNQIELSRTAIIGTDIPLAPLNEQKRVADKLDAVLARVEACREHLDRVPAILKRFRQSVLDAATSGQLTEEWRQTQKLDQWLDLPLSQVASVIDPNPSHRYPSYENGTVPIIATEQFEGRDGYDVSKAKLVNQSFYQERLSAHGFLPHDIVFARKGRLGLARRFPKLKKFVFSHTIFLIRCYEPSHSNYILWYLRNDKCIEWLLQEMHSNQGVPTLGKSFMERLPIRLPPMAEQLEIVRRVEALFAYADSLEARYGAACNQVERLTHALLAKAFRGELVPQDPNDEPASILLERIRAARSSEPAKPKRAKGSSRIKELHKVEVHMLNRKEIQNMHLTKILKERGSLTAEALWSASQLDIDDFYDQLKDEEARGLLKEKRGKSPGATRFLEAGA